MGEVRFSAVIPFPVERVWRLMIQPERMAEWNTEIPEVRDITGPMDRVGGGYRQVWRFAGRWMVSKGLWQVTAVEPLRHRDSAASHPWGRWSAATGSSRSRKARGSRSRLSTHLPGARSADCSTRSFERCSGERSPATDGPLRPCSPMRIGGRHERHRPVVSARMS